MSEFSEKMREGLGATGVLLEIGAVAAAIRPGDDTVLQLRLTAGDQAAYVACVRVELVRGDRVWTSSDGEVRSEVAAQPLMDRGGWTPSWRRTVVAEEAHRFERELSAGETCPLSLTLRVPSDAASTGPGVTYQVRALADVKGQLDPSSTIAVRVAQP